MKTMVWISFKARTIPGGAATVLDPAGCGSDVAQVDDIPVLNNIFVDVKLDETDPRVAKLLTLLQQYGVDDDTSRYTEYSEEDRQNARLLRVGPIDFFDEVLADLSWGTEYDLTHACANCKTGAKQTSPLYVSQRDMAKIRKHRATRTMDSDILVDGGMVKKLKDAKVTGISFGDVRARHENGKWSEVARDQILIEHVLPPMRGEPRAKEIDEQYRCKVCQRGGRRSSPDKPYREEELVEMQDFNLTWEWFGEFGPADDRHRERRPSPLVLVTPKVMNIFRDAGVKTFQWTPVAIEG